ncbi:lytic polysaccharide monooxygenase [Rheinheimera aquimaris]|uniref:lytic polysaccharide monooxygenase n=1 Tax=Rheinheimera aquimaris TaxID=412437 RepID=UPI001E5D11ED|nr:lytic polysaccharide monooxygenase [Rheinheimera aquimaris]MCD1596977.1 lytic polysaccharide monooxygenase [Rheinheimera aquimaris]
MQSKNLFPILLACFALLNSLQANSHGYVEYPKARQQICKDDGGYWWPEDGSGIPNAACRAAYLQSGGYMLTQHHEFSANVADYRNMAAVQSVVANGSLCAAGDSNKSGMDIPSADWQRTAIDLSQNQTLTLRFRATTPHNPSFWQIYLSKPGFDTAAAPLSWDQLQLIHQQDDVPAEAGYYTLQVPMPADRTGPAVLYTRWQRVDVVGEGFYNCSDIELIGSGAEPPPQAWFDKGAFINLQTPAEVGGYARLRLFDANGQELVDERWQINASNIDNTRWATELAAQVNTQYAHLLQIGILRSDNVVFSSDMATNRAYTTDNSYFYNLDLRPAADDGGDNGGGTPGNCPGYDLTQANTYPNWPQANWQGQPDHAAQGDQLIYQNALYQANWWTQSIPGSDSSWIQLCSW